MQHLSRDWATPGRQLCNLAMWLGANAEAKNRQKRKKNIYTDAWANLGPIWPCGFFAMSQKGKQSLGRNNFVLSRTAVWAAIITKFLFAKYSDFHFHDTELRWKLIRRRYIVSFGLIAFCCYLPLLGSRSKWAEIVATFKNALTIFFVQLN